MGSDAVLTPFVFNDLTHIGERDCSIGKTERGSRIFWSANLESVPDKRHIAVASALRLRTQGCVRVVGVKLKGNLRWPNFFPGM